MRIVAGIPQIGRRCHAHARSDANTTTSYDKITPMRIPRFYTDTPLSTDTTLTLPPAVFRHAIQVLRLKAGEQLILFNGTGGEYQATLTDVAKRTASAHIDLFANTQPESHLHLNLVQAIIKPDKMDFAVQKAVELGASSIQPLITQRSVVRINKGKFDKKVQHWQAVAIGACEQSGRTLIPAIEPPRTLHDWLSSAAKGTSLILAPGDYPRISTLAIDACTQINMLIGPEGGFTDEEVEQCRSQGVQAVSLGTRILRAETASIAVMSLLQHTYGDL